MRSGVTRKALVVGILLILLNSFWTIQHHEKFYASWSIFYNVIFILFVLTTLNFALKRLHPKVGFNQGELLTIYVMLCLATSVGSKDTIQALPPIMARPFHFATPENDWQELFWNHIPKWLTVQDKDVLNEFYEGDSTLYSVKHIQAWLPPILYWAAFIFVLLFVMLCINIIIRKQWIEQEKLSYPIIQLPFEMTKPGNGAGFFRNNLLWIGFGVAAGINLIKGLHFLYPAVPDIPFIKDFETYNLGSFFASRPLNAIGDMPVTIMVSVVGLGFLIPLELSFSVWVFHLIRAVQRVLGAMVGWCLTGGTIYDITFVKWQAMGAYIGLASFALWSARKHIGGALKQAFGTGKDDFDEPMPYRWAFLGMIIGLAFLIFFTYEAGMSIWVVIPYFLIYYFVVSLTTTRLRAEVGPPVHELLYGGPNEMMIQIFGTRRLRGRNLGIFSIFFFYNRIYRSHPMPHQLEGLKLAEKAGLSSRRLVFAMLLATLVGIFSAFWRSLDVDFRINGVVSSWVSGDATTLLTHWLNNPTGTDYTALFFTATGLVFTLALMFLRLRFLWWPLHPIGFPIASAWTMSYFWFSIFLSWLIKRVILKSGGLHAYRRAVPFFLGLILGEFIMGGLWDVIDRISGVLTYSFWW
ncbi:DUF6785 family protein [Candidatus Poribacteria bacterium]